MKKSRFNIQRFLYPKWLDIIFYINMYSVIVYAYMPVISYEYTTGMNKIIANE